MIITVTPNPSIDRTIAIDALRHGEVHRATSSRIDPGGKGVNVSRALAAQGSDTLAILPSGGPEGHLMEELLAAAKVPYAAVPVAGSIRMNITVVEPDGTTTKLNEAGPTLSAEEVTRLVAAVSERSQGAAWLVGCGSLPAGAPTDLYADVVRIAHRAGARVAIDSSGEPFAAVLHGPADARPDLIKPNHEELAELVGRDLPTLGDVAAAAREVIAGGIPTVVVSLGGDGALLVTADRLTYARATIGAPVSTVAAGDCFLAGLLHALTHNASPEDALVTAVLWGAAAVTLPGSEVPHPQDLEGISVEVSPEPTLSMRLG